VTVRSEYRQRDREVLVEEQDLVYRSDGGFRHAVQPAIGAAWPANDAMGVASTMSILPCSFGSAR